MKKASKLISLLLCLVMILSLAACGSEAKEEPKAESPNTAAENAPATEVKAEGDNKYGGTLNIRLTGDAEALDTVRANNVQSTVPCYHLFETVISLDTNGKAHPQVCNFEMNDEGTQLTLTVRDGITFHDGSAVTSADVEASVNRWVKEVSSKQYMFGDYLDSYEVVDDKTVVYNFTEPVPLALYSLGFPVQGCYVLKADFLNTLGEGETVEGFEPEKYIGTGPYKFVEWIPGQYIKVVRYEDYVAQNNEGADGFAGYRHAYADEINFIPMSDNTTAAMGAMTGELDYIDQVPLDIIQPAIDSGAAKAVNVPMAYAPVFLINNSGTGPNKIVDNIDFRRAVLACLDIHECMYAATKDDDCIILSACRAQPGTPFYTDIGSDVWNVADKELAKEYLAKSGYNGEKLTWVCRTTTIQYYPTVVAVEQLNEIGINVELQTVESAAVNATKEDQTFWDFATLDGCQTKVEPCDDTGLRNNTFINWNNPEKIELMNKLAKTVDMAERKAIYERIIELLYEDIPYVSSGIYRITYFFGGNVEGCFEGNQYYFWNTYRTDL